MDNLIQKFYSNGKEEEQKYTQFGAFSNSLLKNSGTKFNFIKPNISVVNPAIHNVETKTQISIPKTPNKDIISNNTYLNPKKLIFNSSSDLFNQNIPKNNFAYSTKNNNDINQEPIPLLKTVKQNINTENKKNSTKMQMMEEKMKNLELKSQRLEVINDFFFDMFENNLVKEEINKQRENAAKIQKQKYKEEGYEVSSSSESESETDSVSQNNKKTKKNKKKKKQKNLNLNTYDINNMKKKEKFDPIKYQKNKLEYNKDVLEKIRKNVADYLFEEELKKNEQIQIMGEHINELKSKLISKLDRMEMNQQHQIEKIMFCLINSGEADNIPTNFLNSRINSPHGTRRQSIRRRASMSNYQVPNRTIILKHVGGENEQKNNK